MIYRSSQVDCRTCSLKERCCPDTIFRKTTQSVHEAARDVARAITPTEEYENVSRNQRKKVEVLFAHMKIHLNFNRLRLWGLKSANDELLMVATMQNSNRPATTPSIFT
ncbi:transposase [Marinomonas sp. A79]|uniref:Transposase n=1 Tax=Marinomonas vulgaris TaxID=2823372 RepID=A0ABS5HFB4_9GAMM|nr:transposase [Marinomonas vulgaris]